MDEKITIDQYIAKMMMEGEWDGHSEIVAFSEIYTTFEVSLEIIK